MSIVTQNSVLGRIKKPTGESPKQVPERLPGSGVDFLRNDFNDGFRIRKNQKDTDFILSGFPRTNFIDSRGNTPQEFNINKPFDFLPEPLSVEHEYIPSPEGSVGDLGLA